MLDRLGDMLQLVTDVFIFVIAIPLAAAVTMVLIHVLSGKDRTQGEAQGEPEDGRVKMGYIGFMPPLSVWANRAIFFLVYVVVLLALLFLCGRIKYWFGS
jgi:hypothetical protein